jgi:hypothetical protein
MRRPRERPQRAPQRRIDPLGRDRNGHGQLRPPGPAERPVGIPPFQRGSWKDGFVLLPGHGDEGTFRRCPHALLGVLGTGDDDPPAINDGAEGVGGDPGGREERSESVRCQRGTKDVAKRPVTQYGNIDRNEPAMCRRPHEEVGDLGSTGPQRPLEHLGVREARERGPQRPQEVQQLSARWVNEDH